MSQTTTASSPLLTLNEAADMLRKTPDALRWMIHRGTAPRSALISNRRMFRLADVEAYIEAAFSAGNLTRIFPGQVVDATTDDSPAAIMAAMAKLDAERQTPEPAVFTVEEASGHIGIDSSIVSAAVESGALQAHRTGSGLIVIWRAPLEAWAGARADQ